MVFPVQALKQGHFKRLRIIFNYKKTPEDRGLHVYYLTVVLNAFLCVSRSAV
jgi:hypothetical protein